MKVLCWCGIEGFLQKRGDSYRVQHYLRFEDNRRIYQYHRIDKSLAEKMEVNKPSRGAGQESKSPPAHHCSESKLELQSFTSIDLLPFTSKDSIDWESFKTWLENRHRKKTVVDRFNHASQFSECLIQQNFLKLNLASDSKRQHALKGLAALSRFLGIHNVFTALVKNNGIKWSGKRSEDLIIERLTRTVNGNEISEWVKSIKLAIPELSTFLDFTAATGLRYEESVNAWNLIIDLSAKGKLTEYYNSANQVLEHFRFKELFIRNSKKVFISYVSEDLVKRVAQSKKFTVDSIQCKIKRQKMRLKFGDLREYYASIMVRHLSQAEIDFVQGRISTSIFMRNYFNPAWLTDLKLRALRGSEQILTQIS